MDIKWKELFDQEMPKKYMVELKEFITNRRKETNVLPDSSDLFNCFKIVKWNLLKVIIIGQNPYPTRKDAHGIAFSSTSTETPYALQNILKEVYDDYYEGNTGGVNTFKSNDLTEWGEQGVLLLNNCLTCDEGKPDSHSNKGWEIFVENTVKFINERHGCRLVWMLWGAQAKKHKSYIDEKKHLILEADHPAAAKYSANKWFGNKHFTKANQFINKIYFNVRSPINWGLWKQ